MRRLKGVLKGALWVYTNVIDYNVPDVRYREWHGNLAVTALAD